MRYREPPWNRKSRRQVVWEDSWKYNDALRKLFRPRTPRRGQIRNILPLLANTNTPNIQRRLNKKIHVEVQHFLRERVTGYWDISPHHALRRDWLFSVASLAGARSEAKVLRRHACVLTYYLYIMSYIMSIAQIIGYNKTPTPVILHDFQQATTVTNSIVPLGEEGRTPFWIA